MAIRRIRDLSLARGYNHNNGYISDAWQVVYHMLRCAGWEWLCEWDGSKGLALATPHNHVDDGNMEASGTSSYTAVGASISKVTSEVREGEQSLEITGSGAGGDSVTTDPVDIRVPQGTNANISGTAPNMGFTKNTSNDHFDKKMIGTQIVLSGCDDSNNDGTFTIDNALQPSPNGGLFYQNAVGVADSNNPSATWFFKMPVHIAMWVKKAGTDTWNVRVDRGDGTPVTVGTIGQTAGSDWELLHFDFTTQGTGTIDIAFEPATTSSETWYIDSIMCWRSHWEYTSDLEDFTGPTGDSGAQLQNGDEFLSSSYTFVAGDVGKYLFLYDVSGSNPKNTGCYEILSVAAGVATLDLRSSTFQFANQTGNLRWRLVDIVKWATNEGGETNNNGVQSYNGFALQSPDASGWRFSVHGVWGQVQNNGCIITAAPTDVDFDRDTGFFFPSGISIQSGENGVKTFQEKNFVSNSTITSYPNLNELQWMRGRAGDETYEARLTMLFDEDGKFFFFNLYPASVENTFGMFGYFGQDAVNPGSSAFIVQTCRNDNTSNNTLSGGTTRGFSSWNSAVPAWNFWGTGIGSREQACRTIVPLIGRGDGSAKAFLATFGKANPFSGEEFIRPMIIQNDPVGSQAQPSDRETLQEGLFYCRNTLAPFTPFGSDRGTGDGASDGFSISGTTVTFTEASGTPFTTAMIGHEITISGATSPGNDGTFVITGVPTANTLTYENASGVTETFPTTGKWSINMARYWHLYQGICVSMDEEYPT